MHIRLICIGKNKEAYWDAACAEYQKRLSAFGGVQMIELAPQPLVQSPNAAQIATALEAEGARILEKLPRRGPNQYVIALCIEGKSMPSEQLAARIAALSLDGVSELCFIIGGSHGLSEEVKQRANLRFSMSPMTFPHQLARVMLLEQVYRAFMINSGAKYHK